MTELDTPEQINDLIHGIARPKHPSATGASATAWRKWKDDMQVYYDRVAELRYQMTKVVPGDMPDWVHEAVALAGSAAWQDSTDRASRPST